MYVFGEHDDFGFVTHPTQTVVTQQSLGQVPDLWLESRHLPSDPGPGVPAGTLSIALLDPEARAAQEE